MEKNPLFPKNDSLSEAFEEICAAIKSVRDEQARQLYKIIMSWGTVMSTTCITAHALVDQGFLPEGIQYLLDVASLLIFASRFGSLTGRLSAWTSRMNQKVTELQHTILPHAGDRMLIVRSRLSELQLPPDTVEGITV